ncbi:MAG: SDR family NAD(P)-dependent oxidoreductase [Gammaproteobacteria bacterium]|nr:SDR family NAD(P)-dependent oxidoreductase [Gammaproteobacteria bacterium]
MSEIERMRVIVTGAAGALGSKVAQAFLSQGAIVTGIDVITFDAEFETKQADLISKEDTDRVFSEIGQVDVLANIAGGFTMGDSVVDTSDTTWDFMLNLNSRTVLNTVRAVVPGMREKGAGKIINIGARNGQRGVGQMGAYSASKSIVIRLTESLADELKAEGINVNCVLPSIIDTPTNRRDMPSSDFSKWVKPEALAKVVLFLASSAADPIHGASIPVEGLS